MHKFSWKECDLLKVFSFFIIYYLLVRSSGGVERKRSTGSSHLTVHSPAVYKPPGSVRKGNRNQAVPQCTWVLADGSFAWCIEKHGEIGKTCPMLCKSISVLYPARLALPAPRCKRWLPACWHRSPPNLTSSSRRMTEAADCSLFLSLCPPLHFSLPCTFLP